MTKKTKTEASELDPNQLLPPVTRTPTHDDPMNYWVAWIGDAWRKSVDSIFETGDRLIAFRDKFRHGEWLKAIHDDLHMSRQTVSRLIAIAENTVLRELRADGTRVYHLPAAWGTLYEIAQLPDVIVRKKLTSGEINPSTRRKDVVRMRNDMKPTKQKEKEDSIMLLDKAVDAMITDYQARDDLTEFQHEEVVQATKEFIERLNGFIVNINEINPTPDAKPDFPASKLTSTHGAAISGHERQE